MKKPTLCAVTVAYRRVLLLCLMLSVLLVPQTLATPARTSVVSTGHLWTAPFTGNSSSTVVKEIQEACTHALAVGRREFNQTTGTGHFQVRGVGNATPCPNRAERVAEVLVGVSFASPTFTMPTGSHNVSVVWNLSWTVHLAANATTGTGAECHPCIAEANYSLAEGDVLEILGPTGTSLACLAGGGVTTPCVAPWAAFHQVRSDGFHNRSYSQSHSVSVTVHLPSFYFSGGFRYRIVTSVGVDLLVLVQGVGSDANADVSLGNTAGYARLVSIQVT